MSLVSTVKPEEATGEIKKGYDILMDKIGIIPKPLEMSSISPFFFDGNLNTIKYFGTHPNLDFTLLVLIRMLCAESCNNGFCINLNSGFLKMQGLSDDEISQIIENPENAPIEEKDKAMLLFVINAVKRPEKNKKEDVEKLHDLGWSDADIYDAISTGVNMYNLNMMMKALQM